MKNSKIIKVLFRLIALVLITVLIVSSMAACGRSSDDEDWDEEESEEESRQDSEEEDSDEKADKSRHRVTFAFNLDEAGEAPESQKVEDGERAVEPAAPYVEGYTFVAWLPEGRQSLPYDFMEPVTDDLTLTGCYLDENSTDDTDGDGIPDALETILGTDPDAWDTDKDGLFDGLEYLLLNLDPLEKDTDDNGTPDGEEDTDGDGLENAAELDYNCNPAYYDTDSDGLNDLEEVFTYNTDPQLKDTDGDGVTDGEEVRLGTDPLVPETSFAVTRTGEEINQYNPVTVEVNAVTDADGAGTLQIDPLVSTDIPALTPGSIGYLGSAYELTCEGKLESATLTFSYDPSLAENNEDFLPAIYWYNEEENELVEVPGQIRENGTVTATVTHFSPYGLFDKNLIDAFRKALKTPSAEQMATDENNDGLPDIIAEWLDDGTLDFNNTYLLIGVLDMYGDSDDWDDDGLKNGEEIEVSLGFYGQVKLLYHSNPVFRDTDGDDLTDYEEMSILGTSPKKYNHTSGGAYHSLMTNSKYQYAIHRMQFPENTYFDIIPGKEEKAKQFLINYIYDYAPEDTLKENAEEIARWEEHNKLVEYLSTGSKMLKGFKNAYKAFDSAKGIKNNASSEPAKVYYDGILVKKDAFDAMNSKHNALAFSVAGLLDTRKKIEDSVKKMQSDDIADQIDGFAGLIGEASDMAGLVENSLAVAKYSFNGEVFKFQAIDSMFKKNTKVISTRLTVACDLVEGAVDIADTIAIYGKIKANLSAFNRYLEMFDYMKDNAEDGFTRNAAKKLEEMILDTEGAYVEQLSAACAESATKMFFKTALDVAATYNPYAKLAKTIVDIYKWTGLEEFTNYNIYFKVMKAVSDGCRAKLNQLVTEESSTFCYDADDWGVVQDYLVQLAQSRIIGEYNMYEYCADNTFAGWISYMDPNGNHKTPESYIEDGKNIIKGIYAYSNRIQLKLSHNLPYYNDFYDSSVEPDELDVVLDAEHALKDAAGFYVLSSGAGAWETDLVLNRDGSFYGTYYDMDAGFSGTLEDGTYYQGTLFERTFRGRFEIGEQLDDYSYELKMTDYTFDGTDGEEYVRTTWGAEIRHVNSTAAGMEGWDTYILYSPGTPASMLSYEPWTIFAGEQDYMIGFGNQDDEEGKIRSYFLRTKKNLYTNYSVAYMAFISSEEYRSNGPKFGYDVEPSYAMRDMDQDGIPELIITNGYSARTDRAAYIYTFSMGQVRYIGTGPADAYYLDSAAYPGIFGKYESNWTYYSKNGTEILTEPVAEGSFDPPYTQITSDSALYQAFEAGPREYLYKED